MADAWDILLINSTLISGDAWEHLNNQGSIVVLTDGLEIEMTEEYFDIEIDEVGVEVEVDDIDNDIEIQIKEYDIEVF